MYVRAYIYTGASEPLEPHPTGLRICVHKGGGPGFSRAETEQECECRYKGSGAAAAVSAGGVSGSWVGVLKGLFR